ncbi:MAG: N-acetyltransferase DgcN [Alphaproteobacteria bacterium]
MDKPYLLFLGDVPDQLAAKTARGIADWRPEWVVGQLRLPGCRADAGAPDLTLAQAAAQGARTLIVGVAFSGGAMPKHWVGTIVEAIGLGMDVASGLHDRLTDVPEIVAAATANGRRLFDVRHSAERFSTGKGHRRTGLRLLTVGTDCSVGKKYTVLALEREMRARGMKARFCATGQTGVFIAERGVAIDAVISDFIAGAAEWLSPDNEPDHWDLIEGQGSLFHAAFAGVTLGLLHGAQPDALVLCHEPTRTHMRGLEHMPIPKIEDCFEPYLRHAHLTNPESRFVGIAIDTHLLDRPAAERLLKSTEDRFGLPCCDPIATGTGAIVDRLTAW